MREPATYSDEQYLTVARVASKLDVSRCTVRDWIRNGRLPAVKLGDGHNAPVRVRESDVAAFLVPYAPNAAKA